MVGHLESTDSAILVERHGTPCVRSGDSELRDLRAVRLAASLALNGGSTRSFASFNGSVAGAAAIETITESLVIIFKET